VFPYSTEYKTTSECFLFKTIFLLYENTLAFNAHHQNCKTGHM
jgi:hypothetical protein